MSDMSECLYILAQIVWTENNRNPGLNYLVIKHECFVRFWSRLQGLEVSWMLRSLAPG